MNDKVTELVEWAARKIVVYTCEGCEWEHKMAPHCNGDTQSDDFCEYQFDQAKQILSHPDLALIDKARIPPQVIKRPTRLMGATYPESVQWRGDEHFEPCPICGEANCFPVIPLARELKNPFNIEGALSG